MPWSRLRPLAVAGCCCAAAEGVRTNLPASWKTLELRETASTAYRRCVSCDACAQHVCARVSRCDCVLRTYGFTSGVVGERQRVGRWSVEGRGMRMVYNQT